MTERKSFKRRVRARMEKTGERYTAARRQVADPGHEGDAAAEPDRVSGATLVERTGKTWDEWFALLDEWGAKKRPHKEIARHLREEQGVPGWWAQNVTVTYERARGLRAKHQGPGGWSVGTSKTVAVPVERLFAAFTDEAERERLLPGLPLRPRTSRPNRSARFDWEDGRTRILVYFEDKGAKSTVTVQHEKLADAAEVARVKSDWQARLAELKLALEA